MTTKHSSKSQGSVPAAQNGHDKWERLTPKSRGGSITYLDCDARFLQDAAVAVTEDGAALLLSKTSDGGALCIQILNGTSKPKLYAANAEELRQAFTMIVEIAEESAKL